MFDLESTFNDVHPKAVPRDVFVDNVIATLESVDMALLRTVRLWNKVAAENYFVPYEMNTIPIDRKAVEGFLVPFFDNETSTG